MPLTLKNERLIDVQRLLWAGRTIRTSVGDITYLNDIYFCKRGAYTAFASENLADLLVHMFLIGSEVTDATV